MKAIFSLLIILMIYNFSFAETIPAKSVPANVKASFEKLYSGPASVTWKKKDKNYSATFDTDGNTWMYLFDSNGNQLATGKSVPTNSIPLPARDYFSDNIKNKKMLSAMFVNDSKGDQRFEVTSNDGVYVFDRMGHFIRKTK